MNLGKTGVAIVLLLISLNLTSAQFVSGRLVNQFGASIPNAELKLYIYPNEYTTTSNFDGSFIFSGLTSVGEEEQLPKGYSVSNNFPNPFNPETRLLVNLPKTSKVKVTVYNIIGQTVLDRSAEVLNAGSNQIDLKLDGLSNGIYLAQITIDDKYTVMRKLSLVYGSQHLSKAGPSTGSLLKKNSTNNLGAIDSLIVSGSNVVKTSFTNLPPYTGSSLDLGTLTANIEMELTKETFLADSSTTNKLIEHDSTTFTFSSDAEQLDDLDVGEILVIGVDDGYLKKVTAVERTDDNIVISTENAALDEVIETGSISFQGSFDVTNAKIIAGGNEAIMLNKALGEISVNFGGVTFGAVGDIDINSGTSFEPPEFIFEMDFDKGVKRAEVGIIIENNSFIELLTHHAVKIGGSYSPPWATIKFYPGIPTGIPFINVVPVVKITLSANFEVGIESANRVDINTVVETGIVYENSTFQDYSNVDQTFEHASNLTTYGEINGSLAIPRAGLYLNGIAGAFLELSAGGSFRIANDNSGLYRGIYGNIGINGGFEIDVLGSGLTYKKNIYSKEWELDKVYLGEGNQPPNEPSNPAPKDNATNVSTSSSLSWECSDPDGDAITYDVYFGTNTNPQLKKSNNTSKSYNPGTLNENATYYWKIVASDGQAETEGPVWSFETGSGGGGNLGEPCPGIPTVPYAGKIYNTVQIGNQCWLQENIDVGIMINGGDEMTDNGFIEKYCYNNDPVNCEIYGGLYEWDETMKYNPSDGSTTGTTQGICPNGWHIPTVLEFEVLEDFINRKGAALVDESENLNYTPSVTQNYTGFSLLFGGDWLENYNEFNGLSAVGVLWSSTSTAEAIIGYCFSAVLDQFWVQIFPSSRDNGYSVRCIKN